MASSVFTDSPVSTSTMPVTFLPRPVGVRTTSGYSRSGAVPTDAVCSRSGVDRREEPAPIPRLQQPDDPVVLELFTDGPDKNRTHGTLLPVRNPRIAMKLPECSTKLRPISGFLARRGLLRADPPRARDRSAGRRGPGR